MTTASVASSLPTTVPLAHVNTNRFSGCIDCSKVREIWGQCTHRCGATEHTLVKKLPVPLICCGCCLCTAGFAICPSVPQAAAWLCSSGALPCAAGLPLCACPDQCYPPAPRVEPRYEIYGWGKFSCRVLADYPLPALEPENSGKCYCCYENGRECYCCSSKPSGCCTVEPIPQMSRV